MKNRRKIVIFFMLIFTFLLAGCASSEQKEIATAIEVELDSLLYIDTDLCLFRYKDILKQVTANDRKLKKEEKDSSAGITEKDYTIQVRVPVLTDISSKLEANAPLQVDSPSVDLQTTSPSNFLSLYRDNFSKAIEPQIEEQTNLDLQHMDVLLHLEKFGSSWKATIDNDSYGDLQKPTRDALEPMIQEKASKEEGYQRLLCKENLEDYMRSHLTDVAYADTVSVDDVILNRDGSFNATISYPDAEKIYSTAETDAYAEFEAAGKIFENYASNETDPLFDEKVEDYHAENSVTLKTLDLDNLSTNVTGNIDLDGMIDEVNQSKIMHQEALLTNINANLVWQPVDRPASSVLQGNNSGTLINIHTDAEIGDVYLTFHRLSGDDIYEDAPLTLSTYIRGGDTFSIRLPAGNYKMIQGGGDTWYGEPPAFGPYGDYERSDVLTILGSNYLHDLTLYAVEGGNLPTSDIQFPY